MKHSNTVLIDIVGPAPWALLALCNAYLSLLRYVYIIYNRSSKCTHNWLLEYNIFLFYFIFFFYFILGFIFIFFACHPLCGTVKHSSEWGYKRGDGGVGDLRDEAPGRKDGTEWVTLLAGDGKQTKKASADDHSLSISLFLSISLPLSLSLYLPSPSSASVSSCKDVPGAHACLPGWEPLTILLCFVFFLTVSVKATRGREGAKRCDSAFE